MRKLFKKVTAMFLVATMVIAPIAVRAETAEQIEQTGHLALTRQLAVAHATELMEMLSVTGITMAVVDVDNDFTWFQGFGYADTANQVSVTEYTIFNIASTSKIFTAIAIMQLVEQGRLDLDAPIANYIPGFRMRSHPAHGGDYRNITARMLLTHTSGVHEFSSLDFFPHDGIDRTAMNRLVPALANLHMLNEELNTMVYNNTGYALLGILVAAIAGGSNYYYDNFVNFTQENIFTPAGMTSSSFDVNSVNRANIALAYADATTPLGVYQYASSPSAGGMVSNAYDMARFMHIMLSDGGNILNQQTIQQMIQVQDMGIRFPSQFEMGLGFMHMHHADGIITTGHGGNLLHHTEFLLCFENGIGVYVSTNSMTGAGVVASLANLILRAAVEEKTGTPLQPTPFNIVPVTNVQQLVGWYNFMLTGAVQLVLCDEGLLHFIEVFGMPALTLNPVGDGTFESALGNVWFKNVDGYIFLMTGNSVASERIEPTVPLDAEWLIGQVYFTLADGTTHQIGLVSFNEEGILYFTDGSSVYFWEQYDHYTFFTLGRGRTFGTVVEYSIEDGVIVGHESGITFIIQPHTFIDEPETPVTNETTTPTPPAPTGDTSVPSLPTN